MKELYKRFNIKVDFKGACQIFVNKLNNIIFHSQAFSLTEDDDDSLKWQLCNEIGLDYEATFSLNSCLEVKSFEEYLMRIQQLLGILHGTNKTRYDALLGTIEMAIVDSPMSLGIRVKYHEDKVVQILFSGSRFLDEKLVDDVIGVLDDKDKSGIKIAFEKGLKEFLEAQKDRSKLKNAVRDMQLACDETVKFLFKDKNIGLKHLFKDDRWKKIGFNEYQKRIFYSLNEYIDKLAKHKADSEFGFEDAECVIYLTGIFIRVSIKKLCNSTPA
jgi:hypothetical protein